MPGRQLDCQGVPGRPDANDASIIFTAGKTIGLPGHARVCQGRPRGSPVQYPVARVPRHRVLYGRPSRSPWPSFTNPVPLSSTEARSMFVSPRAWPSFTNPVPLGRTPTHMSVYTFGRVFESIQESTLPVTVVLSPLRFIFSQCVAGGPSCVRVAHEHNA